jgi:asparagine synthase (glutamine-hydrolysing)
MCGIAGIISFGSGRAVALDELKGMADSLAHRGPDDEGFYQDPSGQLCGLAHRRLSVIDLASGQQPLCNADQSLWIVYNGECYNFVELRETLQAKGHQFKTNCDTEVVLHLYEEYGADCVDHIRGMFAFAIWNQKTQQLFLARDRMGQKPLYYGCHQGRFIFASECKAILKTKDFPRRANFDAISKYLILQYVPAPQTAFMDIQQLPLANTLFIDRENFTQPNVRRYWSVPSDTSFAGNFSQAVEQVRAELAEATRLRLRSDVKLGTFLSGGIDSTIITGLMAQSGQQPVTTCSIGFEEKMYNELPLAREVSDHYQTQHHEFTVDPQCTETIEQLSHFYDDPFADCSALPTFHLCRLARSQVTVALTGDGGDETFGGYDRYRALRLAQHFRRNRLLGWLGKRLPGGQLRSRCQNLKRFLSAVPLPVDQQYLQWLSVFSPESLAKLLTHSSGDHHNLLANYFKLGTDSRGVMAEAMVCDTNRYLPGDLNTKIDRASMAFGLELRSPFQDHKVIELAMSLPVQWRINGSISKNILRQSCRDLIPATINTQPKRGFGVPVGQWFRGPLREMFCDLVLSSQAMGRGYFHKQAIQTLLEENDQKQTDHGHRLWSLLMLELWHRNYLD